MCEHDFKVVKFSDSSYYSTVGRSWKSEYQVLKYCLKCHAMENVFIFKIDRDDDPKPVIRISTYNVINPDHIRNLGEDKNEK